MNPSILALKVPDNASTAGASVSTRRLFPFGRISVRTALAAPLLGLALVGPSMLVATLLPFSDADGQRLAQAATAPVAVALQHVLMGPAMEELIFRGLLLQVCRRFFPAWLSVVISAAAFGALHFAIGPTVQVLATVFGLLLGWLALSRASLIASFLCHATFNFGIAFLVGPLFGVSAKVTAYAQSAHAPGMFDIVPAWWVAVSVAAAALSGAVLLRERSAGSQT